MQASWLVLFAVDIDRMGAFILRMTSRKWPQYDPSIDGDMFAWILQASTAARSAKQREHRREMESRALAERASAHVASGQSAGRYSACGYTILNPSPSSAAGQGRRLDSSSTGDQE